MTTLLVIGGALFIFIMAVAINAERNRVSGTCPSCSKQVSLSGLGACSHCGEALKQGTSGFVACPVGVVPDNVPFTTNLAALRPASQWQRVWPERCCVCGDQATKTERVKIKWITGHVGSALAPMNLTDDTKYEVGYCPSHRHGFRFAFPPGVANAKRNEQCLVAIRAVDFYREFMKLNGRR